MLVMPVFLIVFLALAGQAVRPANTREHIGLFTDAQAASGEAIYRQSCASCHGASLAGASAPPLTGPRFAASWNDPRVTLDDLFFVLRTTMPPRASNALSAADHATGARRSRRSSRCATSPGSCTWAARRISTLRRRRRDG